MCRFFMLFIVSLIRAEEAPIVVTRNGIIRGVRSEDGNYNMFMGIPYAKVDKENPFGTSTPYPPFEQIFEANDDSSQCPQVEEFNYTVVGEIDCLRMNIYTPTYVNITSRLPVYVYIFGGKFSLGYYSRYIYGPKYLVRHDVILAVINYRLGPYGFMCLDIPEVPGNQGLKDQIMALRWIQSNINAFGGDPDKVTIGGNSAGASAVDLHFHRDNNKEKLYNQAILESGNRYMALGKSIKNAPIILARYYNFYTDDVYKAISFLATLPPRKIIIAVKVLGLLINTPCIEKKFPGVESYATVEWLKQQPVTSNMSFLIGNNDDEVGKELNLHSQLSKILNSGIFSYHFDTHHEEFQGMSELVESFYIDGDNIGIDAGTIMTDMNYLYASYITMREFVEYGAAAVYMYNFTYIGNKNYNLRLKKLTSRKTYHADEIGYLFDLGFAPEEPTAKDRLVIDKMTKLWTNFIKFGDPTREISELIDVRWQPVTPTSPFYVMNINSNLALTTSSFADKVRFWDYFYKQNKHLLLNI